MKIVTYILTDSMGEPDIFSSIGEVKDILIDIINYEHKDCPSLKEFELKEIEQLFSWLEEDKDKSFSFYIDEREFGVYKKELKIPCGYQQKEIRDMTDFEKCKAALDKVGACYFTKFGENNTNKLVCYSPYVSYNFEKDEVEIHCYVYHWVDTYDADGNFISHEVYEAAYTEELDYDV